MNLTSYRVKVTDTIYSYTLRNQCEFHTYSGLENLHGISVTHIEKVEK
jgi:hypothetical protein